MEWFWKLEKMNAILCSIWYKHYTGYNKGTQFKNLRMTHVLAYTTFGSAQGKVREPWLLCSNNKINSELVKGCPRSVCVCVCARKQESEIARARALYNSFRSPMEDFSSAKQTTMIEPLLRDVYEAAVLICVTCIVYRQLICPAHTTLQG